MIGNQCNYQVTHNDRAWNEYIKKGLLLILKVNFNSYSFHDLGLNYIEFGSFKSTSARGNKYWPSQQQEPLSTLSSIPIYGASNQSINSTAIVQKETEIKHQQQESLAIEAINLAKTNVEDALDYIGKHLPSEFIHHFRWFV